MTTTPQPPYQTAAPYTLGQMMPQPPKKKSKLLWILGGVLAGLALCLGSVVAIGVSADSDTPAPGNVASDVRADAPAAELPAVEQPKVKAPVAKDFKLSVKTLKKQCFGSAGCLVDYRIDVTYAGDPLATGDRTYEVTYDVKGAEEPITNTFTISGASAEVEREESTQTSKSSAKLTAVATSVTEM